MAVDYVKTIQRKNGRKLWKMYRALGAGRAIRGWPPGKAFEHLILRTFERAGAEVTWPFDVRIGGSVIEQIDGAVRTDRLYMLVESKHYSGKVNVEPIAKIRNQLSRRPTAVLASVFSLEGFTEPAKVLTRYASPLNVLLWEKEEVEEMIHSAVRNPSRALDALHIKYKFAVERGVPDYNIIGGY